MLRVGPTTVEKRKTDSSNSRSQALAISLARDILRKIWGFPAFRLKQEAVMARLTLGGSAAVVFPMGGGKSLTYQIPALAFNVYDKHCGRAACGGITLVVSPLIALMKDQVDALKKGGVAAATIASSQSRDAWLDTCDKLGEPNQAALVGSRAPAHRRLHQHNQQHENPNGCD